MTEADAVSLIRIFCALPYRGDGKTDPAIAAELLALAGATAELDAGKIRMAATGKTNIIPAIAVARGDLRAHPRHRDRRDRALHRVPEDG